MSALATLRKAVIGAAAGAAAALSAGATDGHLSLADYLVAAGAAVAAFGAVYGIPNAD